MAENFPELTKNMNPLIEGENEMWVWFENKMQICGHHNEMANDQRT